MSNENLVRNWHVAILAEWQRILGRDLTPSESAFVTSRHGFIALEAIEDHIRSLARKPEQLRLYLRSEAPERE